MKHLLSFIFSIFLTCNLIAQPNGNRGLYFDGVDDRVKSIPLNLNNFTITFWIKTKQTGGSSTAWQNGFGLVDAEDSGGPNDYGVALGNGKIVAGIGTNLPIPEDFSLASTISVNDGAWHHIAVTRAGNTMQIYIDGTLNVTGNANNVPGALGNVAVTIGSLQTGLNYFNGQIDEVRIYNSALSGTAITSDKNIIIPNNANGAVVYYDFNELLLTQTITNNGGSAGVSGNATLGATATPESSDPLRAFRVTAIGTTLGGGNVLGTLPQAIFESNLFTDKNYIDFSIIGTPPFTIIPVDVTKMATDAAFNITAPVIIDGYSQFGASPNTLPVGNNANILIELDGVNLTASAATNVNGIKISANDCNIRGLAINRFPSNSNENFAMINVPSGINNNIQGNFLGFATDGTTIKTRAGFASLGVEINGNATNTINANIIGGLNPQDRNVIGGFIRGIYVFNGNFTKVYNNYIGTEKTGTLARPCTIAGIGLNGTQNAEIGSITLAVQARNVLASNDTNIGFDSGSTNNTIANNYIGATSNGNTALVSGTAIFIGFNGATTTGNSIIGNVIVGHTTNNGGAISIVAGNAQSHTIKGNKIGVGADGITSLPNKVGIEISNTGNIIGGTVAGEGNIIANSLGTTSPTTPSGIRINAGANNNQISQNSIYNNTNGNIFLATVVPIPTVNANPTTTSVSGTCATCNLGDVIEVFESTLGTPAQGETYKGTASVGTMGFWSLSGTFTANKFITATARAAGANTSPFSGGVLIPLAGTTYYSRNTTANWTDVGATGGAWTFSPTHTGAGTLIAPSALDNVVIKLGNTITITTTQSITDVTNDGILTMTSGTLDIAGNVTNNGTFNAGTTSTVTFNGTLPQTIGGTAATTFNNLTIANAGSVPVNTVTANSNINVSGTLTLTSGVLMADRTEIQTDILSGGSSSTYIMLINDFMTSAVAKFTVLVVNAPFTFPISASLGEYTPLSLLTAGNYGSVSVKLRETNNGALTIPILSSSFVNRIWTITATGTSIPSNPQIKLDWELANESSFPLPLPTTAQVHENTNISWNPPTTFYASGRTITATVTITGSNTIDSEFAVFEPVIVSPTTFFSSGLGTGDWNDFNSWYTSLLPIPITASSPPPLNAIVVIRTGHTIKVNSNEHIQSNNTVTIESGGILSFETLLATSSNIDNLAGVAGAKIISKADGLPLVSINNFFATTVGTIIEFAGVNSDVIPQGFIDNPMLSSYFPYQNLIISGTGTKTLSDDTEIEGNLTIENNATLDVDAMGNYDIDIKGDFTNNGTFVARNGSVNFIGTTTQIISGGGSGIANNITINNPAGVSINNNAVIGGMLTLTSGKLIANNASITLTNPSSNSQITSSSSNYVVTTGVNGKLIRNGLTATVPHIFPIGTPTEYAPVTISGLPIIGANNTSASVATNVNFGGTTIFAPYIWNISTENTLNNLGFNFEWLAPISVANTARVQKRVGTNPWEIQITPTTNLTNFSAIPVELRGNEETQFAVFATPAALPTPTTDIKYVQVSDDFVGFSWKTVAGATSYEVQTGTVNGVSAINWVSIPPNTVFVTIGNDVIYQNKNFEYDVTTYYRVRAKGATNSPYSSAVNIFVSSYNNPTTAINADINTQIIISPNPTKDNFIIDKVNNIFTDNNLTFVLMDMTGKVILTETTTQGLPYKMSLENVTKGLYFVKISPLTPKVGIMQNIIKKIIKE